MLMVIFGAGASYDSAPSFPLFYLRSRPDSSVDRGIPARRQDVYPGPWRPPLADSLFRDGNHKFGDIVERYVKLRPILPYLREPLNGRSVEEELESLQEAVERDPERKRQLLSVRYYLQELLFEITNQWLKQTSCVTNYGTLLDQIRSVTKSSETVCLVTFNYDLLLDRALLSFDYQEQGPENQFNAHPVFKLFKPHGSVNWARLVEPLPWYTSPIPRLQPQALIEQARDFKPSDTFVLANATDPHQMFNFPRPIIPAIAIPVQTKTEDFFEWPRTHRAYLEELLHRVTKILIIGWQGKEAHFLELLRSNLRGITHLMVVGRDSADSDRVLQHFAGEIAKTMHPNFQSYAGQNGFTHFAINREGDDFLRAEGLTAR